MRRRGDSLIEVLAALVIASAVMPIILNAVSVSVTSAERVRRADAVRYGVMWWINRMPDNGAAPDNMPHALPDGSVSFEWADGGSPESVRLSASSAFGNHDPYTVVINF